MANNREPIQKKEKIWLFLKIFFDFYTTIKSNSSQQIMILEWLIKIPYLLAVKEEVVNLPFSITFSKLKRLLEKMTSLIKI